MAGDVLQEFVTYGYQVAVVGDIEAHLTASSALRDFVRESNGSPRVVPSESSRIRCPARRADLMATIPDPTSR